MKGSAEIYDFFKREVYRIGWRVQYQAKRVKNKEQPLYNLEPSNNGFDSQSDNRILIEELLGTLPPQGRMIIEKIYLNDLKESDVAKQLNISQQAVSKWKRKMIKQLSQTMNY